MEKGSGDGDDDDDSNGKASHTRRQGRRISRFSARDVSKSVSAKPKRALGPVGGRRRGPGGSRGANRHSKLETWLLENQSVSAHPVSQDSPNRCVLPVRRHTSICYFGCEACLLQAPCSPAVSNSCALSSRPGPQLEPQTRNHPDPHRNHNPTPKTHCDTPGLRQNRAPTLILSRALS